MPSDAVKKEITYVFDEVLLLGAQPGHSGPTQAQLLRHPEGRHVLEPNSAGVIAAWLIRTRCLVDAHRLVDWQDALEVVAEPRVSHL